jgi:hypothetical protein
MDQAITEFAWIATRIPGTRDVRGRKPKPEVLVGGVAHSDGAAAGSCQSLGTDLRERGGTPTRQSGEYGVMSVEEPIHRCATAGADLSLSATWSADLDEIEKSRLLVTIAEEPDLAEDLQGLLQELPVRNRRRLVGHFARRLARHRHSRDAVLPALDDLLKELSMEAAERHLSSISASP